MRFLLSAHASHEELFLFRRLAEELLGATAWRRSRVSWRVAPKAAARTDTKFKVPAVDAPNVNGARLLGLVAGQRRRAAGPRRRLARCARPSRPAASSALYVFDPGPDGSLGDIAWIVDARAAGHAAAPDRPGRAADAIWPRAADFVLPGASFVEKDASYTNDQGRLQGTARAIPPPGEALEDWQILVEPRRRARRAVRLHERRATCAPPSPRASPAIGFAGIATLAFARPMSARHWLQASNPSERWKWDFMFQDLPPVKGTVDPSSLPLPPG